MADPVVPLPGIGGWQFLQKTLDRQQASFARDPVNARDLQYFKDNIAKADTAEKLVADRTLLKVALGAFGLGEELPKRAFVRKAMEGGVEDKKAFANRLVDPKYREITEAFGYGDAKGAQVAQPGFAEDIAARFRVRSFEEAVGAVNGDMRLALNFDREMGRLASAGLKEDTAFLRVLGDKALRAVFEKAFGLPESFGALEVDQQLSVLKERSRKLTGGEGFAAFASADTRDKALRQFFARAQLEQGPSPTARGASALTLLQGGAGPNALFNLLQSRL